MVWINLKLHESQKVFPVSGSEQTKRQHFMLSLATDRQKRFFPLIGCLLSRSFTRMFLELQCRWGTPRTEVGLSSRQGNTLLNIVTQRHSSEAWQPQKQEKKRNSTAFVTPRHCYYENGVSISQQSCFGVTLSAISQDKMLVSVERKSASFFRVYGCDQTGKGVTSSFVFLHFAFDGGQPREVCQSIIF